MSLYQLKSHFQDQLRPISNALVEQNVTANQVTVSAVLLSVGTAYVVAKPAVEKQKLWLLLPSSLFVRMALNAIDGMMAREHNQASTLGAVLNEVGDIVADTALLASLLPHVADQKSDASVISLSAPQQHIFSLIALSISTELSGIASSAFLGNRANQGPLGKSDRAFVLGALGAVIGIKALICMKAPISWHHPRMGQFLILTEAMLLKTCLNRLRYMAALYLMRNPPVCRSDKSAPFMICHSDSIQTDSLSTDGAVSNFSMSNSATQASFLESKTMPSATTKPEKVSKDITDKAYFSEQHIINGESCYNAYDGTAIYYRYWLTMPLEAIKEASQPLRQVILLHRGHEHSGRLAELGEQFAKAGY